MNVNTKISINGKFIYLYEPKNKSISRDLFSNLLELSNEFIMNDDGKKYKKKLAHFDISKDKKFGRFWHFKINYESKKILPKVFDVYLNYNWGHWFWSLKGKKFTIEYQEIGDAVNEEYSIEKMVFNEFKIKANGDSLNIIKRIIRKYQ